MSTPDIIILICTIAGAAFGIFAVVDRLITIKTSKPILEFNIGLSSALQGNSQPQKKESKNKVSAIYFGASIESNGKWVFGCPYLLENTSSLPIKNITIALEYLAKHSFSNHEKIKDINGNILEITPPPELKRSINYREDRVEIRYNIEMLRPGEKIGILDPLIFSSSSESSHYSITGLLSHLKKVENFTDLIIIDSIVFSEQCPPLSKRIKILWFSINSLEKLLEIIKPTVNAFWGGYYPKSKTYIRFSNPLKKRKHLVIPEYADIIVPTLKKLNTSKNNSFYYWDDPEDCEGALVKLNMPAFNYYQLTGDNSTDQILRDEGFTRILG